MIRRKDERRLEERPNIRGGDGVIHSSHLLEKEELLGKATLCTVFTLDPGCSIGYHAHDPEAEFFYILEGELEANDNGTMTRLHPGDVMYTGGGATHSVRNDTDRPARMIAIILP